MSHQYFGLFVESECWGRVKCNSVPHELRVLSRDAAFFQEFAVGQLLRTDGDGKTGRRTGCGALPNYQRSQGTDEKDTGKVEGLAEVLYTSRVPCPASLVDIPL